MEKLIKKYKDHLGSIKCKQQVVGLSDKAIRSLTIKEMMYLTFISDLEACEGKAVSTSEKDLRVCEVSGSWLDYAPFINENSEIEGIIIKHDGGEMWGKVAVKTNIGNFAVVSENYEEAVKRIGSRVKVAPDKERYYCVSILEYHDR